jgi:hypothetical protein
MRRTGLVYFLIGAVVGLIGYGMWIHPHFDWEIFKQTLVNSARTFGEEVVRTSKDPVSILGVVVMFAAFILIYEGIKKMIFGK